MKFEKGKWYYFISDAIYYLKCKLSSNDILSYSEFIIEGRDCYTKSIGRYNADTDTIQKGEVPMELVREVPMELVRQYLPENHPDLLTKEINIVLW